MPRWDGGGEGFSWGSPEEQNHHYAYIYNKIYFKELALVLMESGKPRIFRMGQQDVDPERS